MSFRAMASKEVGDLLREKRFGAWALIFLSFWALFLFFFLQQTTGPQAYYRQSYPNGLHTLREVTFFYYAASFSVLALFVLSDGITKERESGMLAVVGAKPIVRWHVPLAKLIAAFAVYLGTFLVTLLPASILAWALGFAVIEMIAILYVGPFLILYAFLVGLGLFLGTVSSSSKVAIGTAAGIYLPLFFMIDDGPFQMLYHAYPAFEQVVALTPFQTTFQAVRVVVDGGQLPWPGMIVTLALGATFAGAAFWAFARQEVAQ